MIAKSTLVNADDKERDMLMLIMVLMGYQVPKALMPPKQSSKLKPAYISYSPAMLKRQARWK